MSNRKLEMITARHNARLSAGVNPDQRDNDIGDLLTIISRMEDDAFNKQCDREWDDV